MILSYKYDLEGKGQDAVQVARSFNCAAIADGVSSMPFAEDAAKIATTMLVELLENHQEFPLTSVTASEIYSVINKEIKSCHDRNKLASDLDLEESYGTTLIGFKAVKDCIQFFYVGNGSIFQIRKSWFLLPDDQLVPWGISNLLNPHTVNRNGDNPLTRIMYGGDNVKRFRPTVLTLEDDGLSEDYFFICTDGIYSEDQLRSGQDDENETWVRKDMRLILFLDTLRKWNLARRSFELSDVFHTLMVSKNLISDDYSWILIAPEL